ncbi:MAG: hypothetical protein HQL66_03280 [Magnetococcales bacterium]|nr:hypothetical protein [Magnetococcales bacterium]
MPVQPSDILFYKSAVVSSDGSNGGRKSANLAATAVKNNVLPDLQQTDLDAGATTLRKIFPSNGNATGIPLTSCRAAITFQPDVGCYSIFAGTQTDTQADISNPARRGIGTLYVNASAGATSIQVLCRDAARIPFHNGDTIRISDIPPLTGGSGNAEDIVLASTGAVSANGSLVTLTFASGQSLTHTYTAATPTLVSSYLALADLTPTISSFSKTSAAGTYDNTTYPVAGSNVGTVEDVFTLTFTSATAFTCVGSVSGTVGAGTIGSDFAPNNTAFSAPYFVLVHAGFGGTWASGDSITFATHPACAGVWEERIISSGASSGGNNTLLLEIFGSSAS